MPMLEVRLQVVRTLVLWDHAQHLPQAVEALLGIARLAQGVGRGFVFGGQVGWHGRMKL